MRESDWREEGRKADEEGPGGKERGREIKRGRKRGSGGGSSSRYGRMKFRVKAS